MKFLINPKAEVISALQLHTKTQCLSRYSGRIVITNEVRVLKVEGSVPHWVSRYRCLPLTLSL